VSETSITLPAEWAPQSAIMLTWPHTGTDWAANLAEAESVFVEIARAVTASEQLIITCCNEAHKKTVLEKLDIAQISPRRVAVFIHASNDSWARDHGPIAVIENGLPRLLDFEFNGWGGKYPAEKDNQLSNRVPLATPLSLPCPLCSKVAVLTVTGKAHC